MSSTSLIGNPISPFDWLEKSIQEGNIKLFKYDEFHSIQRIGQGGFGEVFSTKLKRGSNDMQFALKYLKQSSNSDIFEIQEFIKEMQFFRTVGYFPNIIQFFGVTRNLSQGTLNKYMLVLEYANGGTLRQYLQSNISNMDSTEKLRLANEMASRITCIHAENIIHRDLNSLSILIHNNSIKISDLGLAKNLKDITGESSKLSSGRPPCFNIGSIVYVGRETPIQNTPAKYVKLYAECWDNSPQAGNLDIQKNLEQSYEKELRTTKNPEKAFELYSKAAEAGNSFAQINLGICYCNGIGTTKNFEKAFELYSKAAETGDLNAQTNLGFCHYNGTGTMKNFEKAFELYSKAAEAGNSFAQNILNGFMKMNRKQKKSCNIV
ncbi:hypothetical protein G9A89_006795 [Geosiphon pyriformis]|nr:hypothetical protein G9A89_006795 [Geosiphon pyriformis]